MRRKASEKVRLYGQPLTENKRGQEAKKKEEKKGASTSVQTGSGLALETAAPCQQTEKANLSDAGKLINQISALLC